MLKITTKPKEFYDESSNEFIYIEGEIYTFEHSLKTVFEWEGIYKKPFLSRTPHSDDEMLHYIKIMCNEDIDIDNLSEDNLKEISDYINSPQTATRIKSTGGRTGGTVTAEVVYAMMVDAEVPFSCDTWNLDRLLTLLTVISSRRNPKKMSQDEIYRQNDEINAMRRAKYNTKG